METLAEKIQRAVREERYVFGAHADMRLRERRILGWQIVEGLEQATPCASALTEFLIPLRNSSRFFPMARGAVSHGHGLKPPTPLNW